jgi:hypothetical protein
MVLGGLLAVSPAPVSAAPLSGQPFAAYGSGAAVITNALQLGSTSIANAEAAFSGGAVNSQGLTTAITNELGINVAAPTAGKNALGRGTGLEAGLATTNPQPNTLNQVLVSGLATATAPPPSVDQKEIALNVDPVAFASVLRGTAAANYDPAFCPVGKPLTFGQGYASNLQLLNTGGAVSPTTGFAGSVLGTSTTANNPRAASQSRTVTYVVPNGDGTFGVVSETRQTVAPIQLLSTVAGTGLLVEVAGEFGLRVTATGKPGGATATNLGNPVLTVSPIVAGITGPPILGPVTLNQIVGAPGLNVDLSPLLLVSAGAPPRNLNGAVTSAPLLDTAGGTSAQAAEDFVRLGLLAGLPGLTGVDLRLGHMEASVNVPAGGLRCDIPVSKVASVDPVTVGQDFNYTISIPSDAAQFSALFNCDLVNITATDTVETQSGNPRIQLISASNGGVISGNKVTFPNLGTYTLGQAPITLTITARIPTNSGAGVLRDTVNVSAALGNCRGGATGEDIVQGNAQLNGGAITGAVTLVAPNVSRGDLAATGGNSWPLVAGGGFLLAALGLVRLRRRATAVPTQS